MAAVIVFDAQGQRLSPCSTRKAWCLIAEGKAERVSQDPFTIRLKRTVELPEIKSRDQERPLAGKRLLLHICCAPCATYTVQYLCSQGARVTGYWYNPNIHPHREYQRRRRALVAYAQEIELPVIWEDRYDPDSFLRAVAGHERFGERCRICYGLRLSQTARVANREGFDLFGTTLLISPYQNLEQIHDLGQRLSRGEGMATFYFENLRRGFAQHHRMARESGLYMQHYCGCLYSQWEADDPLASTRAKAPY